MQAPGPRTDMEALLGNLSQAVYLLDEKGRSILPPLPDTFLLPPRLSQDVPVAHAGYLFLALPGGQGRALCTKTGPGARDVLLLCAQLLVLSQQTNTIRDSWQEALRLAVSGRLPKDKLFHLARERKVDTQLERRLVLADFLLPLDFETRDSLSQALPLAEGDLLISVDEHSLLLARASGQDEGDDLLEYAMALLDTIQNELGLSTNIGISSPFHGLDALAGAHAQAQEALRVGRFFNQKNQVHLHDRLVLERLLSRFDPHLAGNFSALLFNPQTSKILDDEMLETARCLLDNGLNLTDSARALYIHRNTLLYRLDKIQRACGLDLRKFQDALVFKVLLDLQKVAHNTDH